MVAHIIHSVVFIDFVAIATRAMKAAALPIVVTKWNVSGIHPYSEQASSFSLAAGILKMMSSHSFII